MPRIVTREEIAAKIQRVHGTKLRLVGDYTKMHAKTQFKCAMCKDTWEQTPSNIIKNKSGCPHCWSSRRAISANRKGHEQYVAEVARVAPSVEVVGIYTTAHTPILHKCKDCNYISLRRPNDVLSGYACNPCSYVIRATTKLEKHRLLLKRFLKTDLGGKIVLEDYQPHACTLKCVSCKYSWCTHTWNFCANRPWCPNCDNTTYKEYTFPSGRKEYILGYEGYALDYLLSKGVEENSILCGQSGRQKIPTFVYTRRGGTTHKYYPDILVKGTHVVEIKSLYTFIKDAAVYACNKAKCKEVRKTHKFTLMVFDRKGTRIKLPKDWYLHSYKEMRAYLNSLDLIPHSVLK